MATEDVARKTRLNPGIIPALPLAAFGMASLLFAIEGDRLSTLQPFVLSETFSPVTLLAFLVMLALFFWQRKRLVEMRFSTVFCLATGALFSVSLLVQFGQGAWAPANIPFGLFEFLREICQALLLFYWIKVLLPFGAKAVAGIFALSVIILALLSCLTILLKSAAAVSVVSMLPILSAICLCYFREYLKTHKSEALTESASSLPSSTYEDSRRWLTFLMTIIVPMFCFAIVFGNIHVRWVQVQDGAVLSMLIQLGTACGSALGGLLILALIRFFWNRDSIELYRFLLLPIIIGALWLSSFTDEVWIFLYLTLLNIAYKLAFLFIMLAPFMLKVGGYRLVPWCLAYLSFIAGKVLNALLLNIMTGTQNMTSSVIVVGLLLACSIIPALLANSQSNNAKARTDAEGNDAQDARGMKLHNAAHSLTQLYSLTKREEEILILLARGRTAKHVSETLFISLLTAKTHQKNIYTKMQVHSQQELISLIESAIDEQKSLA